MVPGTRTDPAGPTRYACRLMLPAIVPDTTAPALTAAEWRVLARRRLGLRLLAALLAGLWTGLALVVLLAYRPGGPWDLLVAAAVGLPAAVSAIAVVWPPLARSWQRSAVITWLGLFAAMLVGPLVGLVVTQLVSGGGQTLLPSPEVAYAAVLAAGATSLFASLGIIAARDGRDDRGGPGLALSRRPSIFAACALALALTTVMAVAFGGTALLNEVALREAPVPPSRYGPTDASLPNPRCDDPLSIGPGAALSVTAQAFVDDEPVGSAHLTGQRMGTDESWTGSATGPSGPVVTGYTRVGRDAWLLTHGHWQPSTPDPFRLLGLNDLTVDGPVAVAVRRPERPPVAEDVGLEIIEGAKARHCRTAIDGPTALQTFLPLRWIAGGDPLEITSQLPAWRGTLDWWVFADGQLGLARIVINGYPGDAWPTSGLQGEIHAELRAIDRGLIHRVEPPAAVADASPPVPDPPAASATPAVRVPSVVPSVPGPASGAPS